MLESHNNNVVVHRHLAFYIDRRILSQIDVKYIRDVPYRIRYRNSSRPHNDVSVFFIFTNCV